METRYEARLPWWRKTAKVFLQVRDERRDVWRDATLQDLDNMGYQKDRELRHQRDCHGYIYPRGVRVVSNSKSGFHVGAHGVVEFQEPESGRVWVTRDGAGSPCYFWADELTFEDGSFNAPEPAVLRFYFTHDMTQVDAWWITIGPGKLNTGEAMKWCEDNGIKAPFHRAHGNELSLLGFADRGDAMLFYVRFK